MEHSFLSERIYRLLHENAYPSSSDYEPISDFSPLFDSIQGRLDLDVCDDSYDYYSRMVTSVRSHVFNCHALLQRLSTDEFIATYFPLIEWSPYSNLILHNFKKWRDEVPHSKENCFRTLLHMGYLIERSLGCIYTSTNSKKKCPNMLKDILNSTDIRAALGDALVAYIKVFVGPVTSLNLRNLAWHGFLRPCDLHPAFTSVLFFLFVDIGCALDRSGRSTWKFCSAEPNFNSTALAALPDAFDASPAALLAFSRLLAARPDSVSPALLPFFDSALCILGGPPQPLALLDTLCLLLPLLEHVARRTFVRSNGLLASLLRASDGAFFCTFDEILAPTCGFGAPNLLPEEVGIGAVSFLCDLLAYPAGPRLRDRLSHGEMTPECCSLDAVRALLSAIECLLASPQPAWASAYRSRFHPVELCRSDLAAASAGPSLLASASRAALCAPARSLFRGADLEPLLLLLRQIAAATAALSLSIGEFRQQREAQLRIHQLRSRQRQNFTRFEACEPEIQRTVRLCLTTAVVSFVGVVCDERRTEEGQMADLKRLLVLCEKARACADRAKWGELNDLLTAKTPGLRWLVILPYRGER